MRRKRALFAAAMVAAALAVLIVVAGAGALATAGSDVRVTVDTGSVYVSADQMGGSGTYTDAVLQRCGVDRRMQNEPTLAIDPRNSMVWASGSNDYCTVPTAGDAWAGFYRSTAAGASWTDSLLPGYKGDTSPEGLSSPLHQMVAGGALAAGDPVQSWDGQGRLFYMGNNFNRGITNGESFTTRNNTGDIWVATYENPQGVNGATLLDGSKYIRTVIVAHNTFGEGSFNDKTELVADPVTGNVYIAWSDFHGFGCNEILFSRSTDHGATFSRPIKISAGICGNQGPSIAIGTGGNVYIGWEGSTGGSFAKAPGSIDGAVFARSTNYGQTFSKAQFAVTHTPFVSGMFSGNGARECGDAPFNCPTGFTFPRFDLAGPFLAADNVHGTVAMAFQAAQPNGQGQIEYAYSTNGGTSWIGPALLAPSPGDGHQFFPFLDSSGTGRLDAIWYDSRGDANYAPTRPPCNSASGQTTACLNVRYAESADGGKTWSSSIKVTDTPTNLNYEQFGGRLVPFFGDYITVAAVGSTVGATWTDQRNTVAAADPSGDNDGADVAGDPETGGSCTSSFTTCFDGTGGLDQNIYSAAITP
jgi:hypothetical protein